MKAVIVNTSGTRVPRRFLAQWLRRLPKVAATYISPRRYRGKELTLVFLSLQQARRLNQTYRGKNYATDVLSFASDDAGSLGELVFCPQILRRQARENGWSQRLELAYMLTHGFLHLLGYDHETGDRDAQKMFRLQEQIFERLSLSPLPRAGKPKRKR